MNEDSANYRNVGFKCKKVSSIVHCSIIWHWPHFFDFKLCYLSRYLKYFSAKPCYSNYKEWLSYRISGFFRVHPFSALFTRISKSWKMHSRKFDTVSCKSCRLSLLLWFREILIRVDLIHCFRVEFAEKTWRVNNLIYGNC